MITFPDTQTQSLPQLNKKKKKIPEHNTCLKDMEFSTEEGATLTSTDCLFVHTEGKYIRKIFTSLAAVFD